MLEAWLERIAGGGDDGSSRRGFSDVSAALSEKPESGDSREAPTADWGLAKGQAREEYLDRLFRELDEDLEGDVAEDGRDFRGLMEDIPILRILGSLRTRLRIRNALPSLVLTVIGVVLIVGGFVGTLMVHAADVLLILILDVGIVAVMCVAVSLLLLPEKPTLD